MLTPKISINTINHREKSNVSFTSYRGLDFYGTPDTREALEYRGEFHPLQIDEIMKQAPSTDAGLVQVYKGLAEEAKHVDLAHRAIGVVAKQYALVAKDRIAEISIVNPKGSKIPLFSIIPQALSKVSGSFRDRLAGYALDLKGDFEEIVERYFNGSISLLTKEYLESNHHTQNGIKYVQMRQGDSPLRDNLLTRLANDRNILVKRYSQLHDGLNDYEKKLIEALTKTLARQNQRQNERLAKKAVRKILLLGMG